MYYPYLRGKQFDLLAVTTLIKEQRWSGSIRPIIEPVRDSATLKKTIELFDENDIVCYLIMNPQVGTAKLFEEKRFDWNLSDSTSVKKAEIVTKENPFDAELYLFNAHSPRKTGMFAIESDDLTVIPDQGRFRILDIPNKILLREAFHSRKNIADYAEKADDFFGDEHLYFASDSIGFSDYTIEGSRYFDKGGPSRALAIHISYFDAYFNIRIKHFVSDSNENAQNQVGKFFEALDKLTEWYSRNQDQLLLTLGLEELLKYQETKKFPGLGTIKKWSLAHHLELIGAFLEQGDHWQRGWK
ncbi:sce7725 family protein [Candidatus Enterococcus murrayae]|uniref:Sce7725 family protein n=1 Tax=Candidatus Enterococcus murrayae TaxID=2815321 RepID=A0ABS3HLT7_9ENTE|nr:sce7725 family protein [Enterococcus sp. MJM16]MBO0453870.1 sce7725 family protein [Enterococcus sp. MJM16]